MQTHEFNNFENKDNLIFNELTHHPPEERKTEGEEMKLRYGNGSIAKRTRKNKNGSIYTFYQGKYYVNNKPGYVTAKTLKECLEKLAKIRQDKQETVNQKSNRFSLEAWLTYFLDTYKTAKKKISKGTRKEYDSIIKKYVPEKLKNKDIKNVKAYEVQEIINKIAETAQRRARTAYDIFNGAFKRAAINDIIKKDITGGFEKPTQDEIEEETPLSHEQQKKIYALPQSLIKDILTTYIWTGCRRNELLTLEKTFYNRQEQTLYINGTKNKYAKGFIPVFEPLREILERQTAEGKYIFNLSLSTLRRRKEEIEEILGWQFTFKSLRHTFSQNLHDMKIPDIVRASWMRHSKPITTKKVYTHMTDELKQNAIETVRSITEHR